MKPTDRIPVTPELRLRLRLAETVLGGRRPAAVLFDVSDRLLLRVENGTTPTIARELGRKVARVLEDASDHAATLARWFKGQFPEEEGW